MIDLILIGIVAWAGYQAYKGSTSLAARGGAFFFLVCLLVGLLLEESV